MKNEENDVQRWLEFAAEDLHAADSLLEEDIPNVVCFHAQQCVEKVLKGLLVHHNQYCPKVHDLDELYKRCVESGIFKVIPFRKEIGMLGMFYLPTRYPDALVGSLPDRSPTRKDAQTALDAASAIYIQLRKGMAK